MDRRCNVHVIHMFIKRLKSEADDSKPWPGDGSCFSAEVSDLSKPSLNELKIVRSPDVSQVLFSSASVRCLK